ncbi:hypothetical protein F441_16175 [Phytophthora nicotianae CJ01A1]|uniref:Uncharacterized protein n=1 Tax=Phytophthora nicotianae CJ01A1 TaxID=1317063 RepID=W2WCD3_PHYNI|nr:hypothetical protein F441_16175 [Phytophthora nicotianae CJ01A1]
MLWQFKEMNCSASLRSVSWRSPIYGLNGTRRRRDCPTLRPFSLPRRATSEHALSPSLQPSLPVSPRPLDRLQVSPKLALRVMPLRLDPRSRFCLPWLPARRLKGRCHLLHPLVLLIIFLDLSDRLPRVTAEVFRRPLQLLRQARLLTMVRALPANPVQLASLIQTPRETIVVFRSRIAP